MTCAADMSNYDWVKTQTVKSPKISKPLTSTKMPEPSEIPEFSKVQELSKNASVRSMRSTKKAAAGGYELVKPQLFFHRNDDDSWRSDDDSQTSTGSKKKNRAHKKRLIQVIVFFAILIVVVLICIGVTGYFMIWKRQEKKPTHVDSRLTTKTSICRLKSGEAIPECIYENRDAYGFCDRNAVCEEAVWTFDLRMGIIMRIQAGKGSVVRLDERTTDNADCGFTDWCQSGRCVASGIDPSNWWPAGGNVFAGSQTAKWIKRKYEDLRCLNVADEAKSKFDSMLEWYANDCNVTVCDDNTTTFGLRIEFYQCDLSWDPTTGIRKPPCTDGDRNLLKLVKCKKCLQFDAEKEETRRRQLQCPPDDVANKDPNSKLDCVSVCTNGTLISPDGFRCGSELKGICLTGACLTEISDQSG